MNADINKLRQFGLTLTIALVVIRFVILFKSCQLNPWLLYAALAVFGLSFLHPRALAPLHKIAEAVGILIGKVVSYLVLGLFFYLVIVPVGLGMRLFGRDPLQRKFNRDAPTYWIKRSKKMSDPKRMERSF